MADFLNNLWSSVFTPGTSPTLLLATNATFGLLQTLLAALLVATRSIHFVILSLLCGALWWSINWFASELQAAQQKEEEAKRLRRAGAGSPRKSDTEKELLVTDKSVAKDSETDTETEVEGKRKMRKSTREQWFPKKNAPQTERDPMTDSTTSFESVQASTTALRSQTETRQRNTGDLSGEISTDSEWEKVDGQT